MAETKFFIIEPDKFRHNQIPVQCEVFKSFIDFSMLQILEPYGTLFAFSGVSV